MIRVILDKAGELKIDRHGGRGGYLHGARACWSRFLKKKSHYRAFRVEVGKTVKEKLVAQLSERYRE